MAAAGASTPACVLAALATLGGAGEPSDAAEEERLSSAASAIRARSAGEPGAWEAAQEAAIDALEAWEREDTRTVDVALQGGVEGASGGIARASAKWSRLQRAAQAVLERASSEAAGVTAAVAAEAAADGHGRALRACAAQALTAAAAAECSHAAALLVPLEARLQGCACACGEGGAAGSLNDLRFAAEGGLAALTLAACSWREAQGGVSPAALHGHLLASEPLLHLAQLACGLSADVVDGALSALRATLPGTAAAARLAEVAELFAAWDAGAARLGAALGATAGVASGSATRLAAMGRCAAALTVQAPLRARVARVWALLGAHRELEGVCGALGLAPDGDGALRDECETFEGALAGSVLWERAFDEGAWEVWDASAESYEAAAASARERAVDSLNASLAGGTEPDAWLPVLRSCAPLPVWAMRGAEEPIEALVRRAREALDALLERVPTVEVRAEAQLSSALDNGAALRGELEAPRNTVRALELALSGTTFCAPARTLLMDASAMVESITRRLNPRQLAAPWIARAKAATCPGGSMDLAAIKVLEHHAAGLHAPSWSAARVALPCEAEALLDGMPAALRHGVRVPFAVMVAGAAFSAARGPAAAIQEALQKLQQAAHAAERLPSGIGPTARNALERAEHAIERGLTMHWTDPALEELAADISAATVDLNAFSQGVETSLALLKQAVAATKSCPMAADDVRTCCGHAATAIASARAAGASEAAAEADAIVTATLAQRLRAAVKSSSALQSTHAVEVQVDSANLTSTVSPPLESVVENAVAEIDALAHVVAEVWPAVGKNEGVRAARDEARSGVDAAANEMRGLLVQFDRRLGALQGNAEMDAAALMAGGAHEWAAAVSAVMEAKRELAFMVEDHSFGPFAVDLRAARGLALEAASTYARSLGQFLSAEITRESGELTSHSKAALVALEQDPVPDGPTTAVAAAAAVLAGATAKVAADSLGERAAKMSARHRALREAVQEEGLLPPELDADATAAALAVLQLSGAVARHEERVAGMRAAAIEAVESELESLGDSVDDLIGDWSHEITSSVGAVSSTQTAPPSSASGAEARASDITTRCERLTQECDRIDSLRVTLKLEAAVASSQSRRAAVADLATEVEACAAAWRAVGAAWHLMGTIEQRPLDLAGLSDAKEQLESCAQGVRSAVAMAAPLARVRRIGAVHEAVARKRLESLPLLRELASAELASRHWEPITHVLSIAANAEHNHTFGELWGGEIMQHEGVVREQVERAGGELSLDNFFKSLDEGWQERRVSVREASGDEPALVRQWDVLFNFVDDDLTSLSALRASPHYAHCEDRSEQWTQLLTLLRTLLVAWRGAQKRFLALSAAIEACPDLVDELPREAERFEFAVADYKRVTDVPTGTAVLDLLKLGDAEVLVRAEAEMGEVERALHGLLEARRDAFPRLYFVGNDDLLSLLGAARRPEAAGHLLINLFPGVARLEVCDQCVITALLSPEGERLPLLEKLDVRKFAGTQTWLVALETSMRSTLAAYVTDAHKALLGGAALSTLSSVVQALNLAMLMHWTARVDKALSSGNIGAALEEELARTVASVQEVSAASASTAGAPLDRRRAEMLVIELLHERDSIERMVVAGVDSADSFEWLRLVRAHAGSGDGPAVAIAGATFDHGLEWYGANERVVRTPLTDRCYLTLATALSLGLGAAPSGPAGTGKTETVKALGVALGRPVVVLNADTSFDALAMSRILGGIVQSGCWLCVDEINRLEPAVLSLLSEQIAAIQQVLRRGASSMAFLGKEMPVAGNAALFVTLNPAGEGYGARSELPDSLKGLFRPISLARPDSANIATVLLFSKGFTSAAVLAQQAARLYDKCGDRLSSANHYDFSLRALKAAVRSAGALLESRSVLPAPEDALAVDSLLDEARVFVTSVRETVVPKLLARDVAPMDALLSEIFGEAARAAPPESSQFRDAVLATCSSQGLQARSPFVAKVVQLRQIIDRHAGIMLVGEAGHGKTSTWEVLFAAMEVAGHGRTDVAVVDPKALGKAELFGAWDESTREFRDGVLTALIRNVAETGTLSAGTPDSQSDLAERCAIILDGDVSPEWIESLNSALDDNRTLSLPTGERLRLHPKLTLLFECRDLSHASAASVSRCGVVWLGGEGNPLGALVARAEAIVRGDATGNTTSRGDASDRLRDEIATAFAPGGLVETAVALALERGGHVMPLCATEAVLAARALAEGAEAEALDALAETAGGEEAVVPALRCRLLLAAFWAAAAGLGEGARVDLSATLLKSPCATGILALPPGASLADVHIALRGEEAGYWRTWEELAPEPQLRPEDAGSPDCVVPTSDTVRHEWLVDAWLMRTPLTIMCGPPGTGKTMTLTAALSRRARTRLVTLPCSSATSSHSVLATLRELCDEVRQADGTLVLRPRASGDVPPKGCSDRVVLFLDEVNLAKADVYGTQSAVELLRQLATRGGFWEVGAPRAAAAGLATVPAVRFTRVSGISFVCACNPASDAGRSELNPRLLATAPVIFVGAPTQIALERIYGAFAEAALRPVQALHRLASSLASACLQAYHAIDREICGVQNSQAHYVTSPRELSRWMRAVRSAAARAEGAPDSFGLVRIWLHAACSIFRGRLATEGERERCDRILDEAARKHFGPIVTPTVLLRPVVMPEDINRGVETDALASPPTAKDVREYFNAQATAFADAEGMDRPVVMFDEAVETLLNICSILREPMGHLLLLGPPGCGRALLSRLAARAVGLRLVRIHAHRRYTAVNFEEDLRAMLVEVGANGTKTLFLFDEANALDSSFLERLNALLQSGEIPGLFTGEELVALLAAMRHTIGREGAEAPADDESVYRIFIERVREGLHVVFTMNPAGGMGFAARAAASPALISRCVVQYFGQWSPTALREVASAMVGSEQLASVAKAAAVNKLHESVCDALVKAHTAAQETVAGTPTALATVSPRAFVEVCTRFSSELRSLAGKFEEDESHLLGGLGQLRSTEKQMKSMRSQLKANAREIRAKDAEAAHTRAKMEREGASAASAAAHAEAAAAILARKSAEVDNAKAKAVARLVEVQPALDKAKAAVSGIQRAHLDELRALKRPPRGVHMAVEATMTLLQLSDGEQEDDQGGWDATSTPPPRKEQKFDAFDGPVAASTPTEVVEKDAAAWRTLLKRMKGAEFISSILKFDTQSLSEELCKCFTSDFASNEAFEPAIIRRASRACGLLADWCLAQVRYAGALRDSAPLQAEVARLEDIAAKAREELAAAREESDRLQARVANLASELEGVTLAREKLAQQGKANEARLERLERLREALKAEEGRWARESSALKDRKQALTGGAALRACFLTYGGALGPEGRQHAMARWERLLAEASPLPLPPRRAGESTNSSLAEALAGPAQLAAWATAGLASPGDRAAIEAAVAIEHAERVPLVLDPTGEVVAGLVRLHAMRMARGSPAALSCEVESVSALADGFLKMLEGAMRFGTCLIVRDADSLDPILNPYLNGDVRRLGGRRVVHLGSSDVDLSPSFRLILACESEVSAAFPADVLARVTLVDAAATPPAVAERCLARAVSVEQPALERRRDQLAAQVAELVARQRALEHELLVALAQAPSSMVEDDSLAARLEELTTEAGTVTARVTESGALLETVERARLVYHPLGRAAGLAFRVLRALPKLNELYQFGLDAFMAIYDGTLAAHALPSSEMDGAVDDAGNTAATADGAAADAVARVDTLSVSLLRRVCDRVRMGMLNQHHLPVAVALAAVRAEAAGVAPTSLALLRAATGVAPQPTAASAESASPAGADIEPPPAFTAEQWQSFVAALPCATLAAPAAEALASVAVQAAIGSVSESADAMAHLPPVPEGWEAAIREALGGSPGGEDAHDGAEDGGRSSAMTAAGWELALLRALRLDRFSARLSAVVDSLLGAGASVAPDVVGDLEQMAVQAQAHAQPQSPVKVGGGSGVAAPTPHRPVLLACVTGVDGGARVAEVAAAHGVECAAVAAGADEGDEAAAAALAEASTRGHFVVLRNMHLAPSWLPLVKRFLSTEGARAARGFRLFLTMEIASGPATPSKVSLSLGFPADVRFLEPAPGVRAAVRRSLAAAPLVAPSDGSHLGAHAARPRVRLLLAWLHACLNERCRFAPVGFSKAYDFGDADERAALRLADTWLNRAAAQGAESVPWDALRGVLLSAAYGGRVDIPSDLAELEGVVASLFTATADVGGDVDAFQVCPNLPPLPSGADPEALSRWADALPEESSAAAGEPPTWVGLSPAAECSRLENAARVVLAAAQILGARAGAE